MKTPTLLIIPILVSLVQGQNDWFSYFYQNFGQMVEDRVFHFPWEASSRRDSELQPEPSKTKLISIFFLKNLNRDNQSFYCKNGTVDRSRMRRVDIHFIVES
jgi:hypothetical protein